MKNDLLFSYYGDDFTGSTDVMESLSLGGIETVLFTSLPTEAELARFHHCQAIGLAGAARSQSPRQMSETLPAIFSWLKGLDAKYCHYKICSTCDSSPHMGSIGRALEIGLEVFGQSRGAIIVGVPQLQRYTFFGTLFAGYQGKVFRIDRHPVMGRHPSTPMDEADLLVHLSRQTDLALRCVAAGELETWLSAPDCTALDDQAAGLLIDVCDLASQRSAGQLLDNQRDYFGPFLIGSSGVEYALLSHWGSRVEALESEKRQALAPVSQVAIVSGSCSPTTGRQIDYALARGFQGIELNYAAVASGVGAEAEILSVRDQATAILEQGGSPLVYTAKGETKSHADAETFNANKVGKVLGDILSSLTRQFDLTRVGVAGGDTSSHALAELDIYALTLRKALPETPGSPVCQAHLRDDRSLEIVLKGGQIGSDSYFVDFRNGSFL